MIVDGSLVTARSGVAVDGVDPSRVVFRPIPRWLLPLFAGAVRAITFDRTVLVHPEFFDEVVAGDSPELVAHELIHVRQWAEAGVVTFLVRYVADYLRLRVLGCGHDDAYRHIGYEWAAYSGAAHIVQRP